MVDRITGVLAFLLAAVYLYATEQFPALEISDPLGPKAFPRLIGIGLLLTGAALIAEAVRKKRGVQAGGGAGAAAGWRQYRVAAAAVLWTILYFALFEYLGYALATSLCLLGLTAYFHRGKWTANLLTSVLYSFVSYALFANLLDVRLPRGILPF